MQYYFYILNSQTLDRYYYGHTADIEDRLRKHNHNHKGFTGKRADWEVVYTEQYPTKELAYARERQIKGDNWNKSHKVWMVIKHMTVKTKVEVIVGQLGLLLADNFSKYTPSGHLG